MRIALKLVFFLMLGILVVLFLNSIFRPNLLTDQLTLAASLLLVTSVITTGLCVTMIGRPINALRDQVRAVADGSPWGPMPMDVVGEIGDLALEINRMCQEVQTARQRLLEEAAAQEDALESLRHMERLATVGKVASIVAHELGTPLNVISARAAMIASGEVQAQDAIDSARIIVVQCGRMSRIIQEVLGKVRKGRPIRRSILVRELARQASGLVSRAAHKRGVAIKIQGDDSNDRVNVDGSRIIQVLTNLMSNAIQSMVHGGSLTLRLTEVGPVPGEHRAPDGYSSIAVCDTGTGISPEHMKVIFKPFFTTRGDDHGTGLGLSVSEGIVRDHGGWIEAESVVNQGSCFKVCLPHGGRDERQDSLRR